MGDSTMTPRTAVRDVTLSNVSATLDDAAVQAVEDSSMTATELACLSGHELLDFDEFRAVSI